MGFYVVEIWVVGMGSLLSLFAWHSAFCCCRCTMKWQVRGFFLSSLEGHNHFVRFRERNCLMAMFVRAR